jgi:hypothetical protein
MEKGSENEKPDLLRNEKSSNETQEQSNETFIFGWT